MSLWAGQMLIHELRYDLYFTKNFNIRINILLGHEGVVVVTPSRISGFQQPLRGLGVNVSENTCLLAIIA